MFQFSHMFAFYEHFVFKTGQRE